MHSSKLKQGAKLGIKLVAFLLVCALVSECLGYFVAPSASYTRIQFHDLYTTYGDMDEGANMDVVFLGSSHMYRTFDTTYFDEALGEETYNFGTSQQTIEASYYILKEIIKTNDLKQVVFDITYTAYNEKDRNPIKSVIISQYMKPSLNRLQFILAEYELEEIFCAMVPAFAYRDYFNAEDIAPKIKKKGTEAYKNYDASSTKSSTEWMEKKGFVYTDKAFEDGWMGQMEPEAWTEEGMDPKKLEYLYKIISLCREENIDLVMVTAPLPPATLLEVGNYNEIDQYFQNLAKEEGIDYYNLNLVRKDVLDLQDYEYYDWNHVSGEGAKKVSEAFSRILAERKAGSLNYDDYFYSSFEEAEQHIDGVTNAFYTVVQDDVYYFLLGQAYAAEGQQIEYRYYTYRKDIAKRKVVRDWSTDPNLVLPKEELDGKVVIMGARVAGSKDQYHECQKYSKKFPVSAK